MTDRDFDPLPSLHEHAQFVRAIARRLAADPGTADDLVQETFVRVLRQGAPQVHSVRAWLATVVRNVFRDQRAADLARRQREQESARRRDERGGDGDPLGIDQLSRALQALPADYRHALHLRYYAQLSIEQMADELRVPAATVKTRLHRGLGLLRADLVTRAGGEGRMRALLAPLVGAPAAAAATGVAVPALVGVLMMKQVLGVALFVAVVFVGVGPFAWWRGEGHPAALPPVATAIASHGPDTPLPVAVTATSAADGGTTAVERHAIAEGGTRLAGRLVYAATRQAVPFGRLEVRDAGQHEVLHTDADGGFATERTFAAGAELYAEGLAAASGAGAPEGRADRGAPPIEERPVAVSLDRLVAERATRRPDGAWVLPSGVAAPAVPWHPVPTFGAAADLEVPVVLGPTWFVAMVMPPGYDAGDFRAALTRGDAYDVAWLRRHGDWNAPLRAAAGCPAPFWCRLPTVPGPGGPAELCVYSDDGLWRGHAEVSRVHGVQMEPVTIELQRAGVVHGVVRDGSGAARPGVDVTLVRTDATAVHTTSGRSDELGRYRILQAVPGVARLDVTGEDVEPWRRTIVVPAGSHLEQDIVLVTRAIGGALAGTITTDSGKRFRLCSVILTSRNDSSIWRTANIRWQQVEGRERATFAFEQVPLVECDVTLHTFLPCGVPVRRHRVTAPQAALSFHIEDRPPLVPVRFEVAAAGAAEPIGGWSMRLTGDAGWQLRVAQDQPGAVVVGLPEGQPFVWQLVGAGVRSQRGRAVAGAQTLVAVVAEAGFSVHLEGTDIANYYAARDVLVFADGVPVGATDAAGELVIDLPSRPQAVTLDTRLWRVFDDGSHHSDIDGATGAVRPPGPGRTGADARWHIYVRRVY